MLKKKTQTALDFDPQTIGLVKQVMDDLTDETIGSQYEVLAAWKGGKAAHFKTGGFKGAPAESDSSLMGLALKMPGIGKLLTWMSIGGSTKNLFGRIWNSGKNLFSGRKMKSNVLSLGLGAVAVTGMVALCVLFPPAGATAAALGGALTLGVVGATAALAVGTAIATVVAGALAFKVGESVASKIFTDEKFELNQDTASKFKKEFAMDEQTVSLMNRYLLNRIKTVKSELYQQDLKNLQDFAIERAEPLGIYRLNRFFCAELEKMINEPQGLEKYENDIKALEYFLKKLSNIKGYVQSTVKEDIGKTLSQLQEKRENIKTVQSAAATSTLEKTAASHESPGLVSVPRSLSNPSKHKTEDKVHYGSMQTWMPAPIPRENRILSVPVKIPMSKDRLDIVDEKFHQHLNQHHQDLQIEKVTRKYNAENLSDLRSGRRSAEYHFETKDNIKIPPLTKEEAKSEAGGFTISTYMDLTLINQDNRTRSIEIMAVHAKSFAHETGGQITVHNIKDDDFVVDLSVALKRHGLSPSLDLGFANRDELIRRIEEKSQIGGKTDRLSSTI